ncbi:MAG: hypothetical protein JSW61_14515 [Candidatus Thorarchaeota archaeon]|nr:MAG: hypothetical protein JSW61_14515 [Candidatus Thorarchaeota archaeon]
MSWKSRILSHLPLIVILIAGLVVWIQVFQIAAEDYLAEGSWNSMHAWLGGAGRVGVDVGQFDFFGLTIPFQFEGYSDYSYFYKHWGNNVLNGLLPYSPEFGYLEIDGIVNENGVYFFPPLYAILCAFGVLLEPNIGIGIILSSFGFVTVLPVYGIATELSNNRRVGEIAALTYLFNPNVLYHVTFLWMNTPPFIFFFFSGFYMLITGRRHAGTLLIVMAALFKQTAWFLGIPLVVHLLIRKRNSNGESSEKKNLIDSLASTMDFKAFATSVVVVLIFGLAVLLPFLLAQPDTMLSYMSLAAGGFPLESFTDPPGYGSPMRFQVLPVVLGFPDAAQFLDGLVYYGILLWFGVTLLGGYLFFEPKMDTNRNHYFRRLLFVTMLMMFWVHLMGPRGVYKYYFTLFAPFFSIFSSRGMVVGPEERVKASPTMLFIPALFSSLILIPPRNIYFVSVIAIYLLYILASVSGWRRKPSPDAPPEPSELTEMSETPDSSTPLEDVNTQTVVDKVGTGDNSMN